MGAIPERLTDVSGIGAIQIDITFTFTYTWYTGAVLGPDALGCHQWTESDLNVIQSLN